MQATSWETISATTVWRGVAPTAHSTAWLRAATRAAKAATIQALTVASTSSSPAVPRMIASVTSRPSGQRPQGALADAPQRRADGPESTPLSRL